MITNSPDREKEKEKEVEKEEGKKMKNEGTQRK
jgi:hypothetical protein